ncbi:MAG: cob(I)yrinic acid a,c-diamide adenosyltransferase [Planctomycetes bacterium]|nr:cob(I)yrinic acid a,c-diamide adenosyltransferase [Planctomycetota bacterium]
MTPAPGLTIIYTGEGKGKTTAALGLAVRAAGHGMSVRIRQFIKSPCDSGELQILGSLADKIDLQPLGRGFLKKDLNAEELAAERIVARQALDLVREEMLSDAEGMLILDEVIYLVNFGLLEEEELLKLINCKPPALHLVLTGRGATPNLIAAADLVTEMRSLKHPFDNGAGAQQGIEF